MKEKIKSIMNTKQFHMSMVAIMIVTILFVVGIISLKYNVEGEGNLPFYISKISTISNTQGVDAPDETNKWNINVNQNNDIYFYINRNNNYKDTETISSIKLNNFIITQNSKVGEVKLLKPDSNLETAIFVNNNENEVDEIEYIGDVESNIKNMKISNQGGLVAFRYAISNIGNYISNDDVEINHNELLKKLQINNDDLKFSVSFDIYISLNSGKTFKSSATLDFPVGDVVNNGSQGNENTDLKNIVFKRM